MLKKLYKHEFKASSQYFMPLYLAVVVASVLLAGIWGIAELWKNHTFYSAVYPMILILIFTIVIGISAGTFIIAVYRFYRTMISSEGYLSYTLPVTVNQLVLSRLLVAITYYLISTILTILLAVMLIAVVYGASKNYQNIGAELAKVGKFMWKLLGNSKQLSIYCLDIVVGGIVQMFAGILLCYMAMALAQCMRNHKILWTVVYYICIKIGISMIQSILGVGVLSTGIMDSDIKNLFTVFQCSFWILIVLYVLVAVAGYFITVHMFNKKLNLE